MDSPAGSRSRARSSRYRRSRFGFRRLLGLVLLAVVVGGFGALAYRTAGFLSGVARVDNPLQVIEPAQGTIAWKLKHGQQVNVLLLGYGGVENDAPYLTDSMVVLSVDPASKRVAEVSIPRDLMVGIDAWPDHHLLPQKINVAFSVGVDDATWTKKRPEFTRQRDAGGKLAEQSVSTATGLQFDGYVAVDFKAFRDLVNALGGVDICLDTPLDDTQYPNYNNGYIRGGIHFPTGCQTVDGEKALELARSRHATQPEQASDFGRARRQQLLINAIRKKATSVNALAKAPQLMDALQKNFRTDLGLADLKAVYDWSGKLPDTAINRVSITDTDLVDGYFMRKGSCGDFYAYVLCAQDPSFKVMHSYFGNLFLDPDLLKEAAPVELDNASLTVNDLGPRVTSSVRQLGLKVSDPIRGRADPHSVVYDYSGGKYPLTAKWLADFFGATVVTPASGGPAPAGTASQGLVVVLGSDFARRWLGQA